MTEKILTPSLVTYAYIVHCDFSEGIIGTVGGAGRFWFGNDKIYLIRSLGSVIFFWTYDSPPPPLAMIVTAVPPSVSLENLVIYPKSSIPSPPPQGDR